jgi:2-oxoglutarate dehydrogenase complex dehydrogenase (E1) component-like enzyme
MPTDSTAHFPAKALILPSFYPNYLIFNVYRKMKDTSAVFNAHPQYIESLYRSWQTNPESVESDWAAFFKGFDFALSAANGNDAATGSASTADLSREFAVLALIHGYRNTGTHVVYNQSDQTPQRPASQNSTLTDYGLSDVRFGPALCCRRGNRSAERSPCATSWHA